MGCGPTNKIETIIQLAAIMTPADIFDKKDYPGHTVTNAKKTRNFYTYQSTSLYQSDPIGFRRRFFRRDQTSVQNLTL